MTTTNTYGRQVVVPLTNKSGGGVIAGDVVVVGTANNDAFTTTTSAAFTGTVGVAQETIADNAVGRVLISGYAALINTTASVTRQNFGTTSTTVKKAVDAGSARTVGTFCQFLTGGTTPDAIVYPADLGSSAGSMATDALWDAAGDMAVGTGANTGAKLTIGATRLLLKSNGTTATWAYPTFIGARAFNSAAQSIANNTNNVVVTMDSEQYDTDTIHSGGAFTVPTGMDGKWRLNAAGLWASNSTGIRYCAWYKNGSVAGGAVTTGTELLPRVRQLHGVNTGDYEPIAQDITVVLAAADVVRWTVFQNSGGALNFGDSSPYCSFAEVQFLGL